MSERNSLKSGVLGIALGLAVMASAGGVAWFWYFTNGVYGARATVEQSADASCQEGVECSKKDLVAQTRMADATEAIFDLAVWQFYFSLVALGLIGWTLAATRATAKAAIEASRAAHEANEITRELGIGEQRPWVTVKPTHSIKPTYSADANAWVLFVEFNLTNVGHRPASCVDVSEVFEWVAEPDAGPDALDRALSERGKARQPGVLLLPGAQSALQRIIGIQNPSFSEAGFVTVIAGWVQYQSAGSKEIHVTPFAYHVKYKATNALVEPRFEQFAHGLDAT